MDTESFLHHCIDVCEERKAADVRAYDVRGQSILADYFLICSGNSVPHIRAIVGHLSEMFKNEGLGPASVEGVPASRWVLVDCEDVLIHVFHPETREYYSVETLLEQATRVYPDGEPADPQPNPAGAPA